MVASWSVDRLGRSLIDLVNMLQELHATGVDLYLHQQGINTTTPAGKALFGMMGVFAEFERGMIQERVRAGMARAKAKGTKSGNAIGRPSVSAAIEDHIRELRASGLGMINQDSHAGRVRGIGGPKGIGSRHLTAFKSEKLILRTVE